MRKIALLSAVFFAMPSAHAQSVVAAKSDIGFTIKQMGVKFDGRFRKWTADIVFRPNALASSKAVIDVDLRSIDLASDDSDAEAKGPLWFNAAKFPTAHFASTAIRDVGGNRYEVAGKLTLKGITRDCIVPISVASDASGSRIADATFSIRRLDYKIGEGEWADTSTVDNDIVVHVKMTLAP
ncbi:MAG TPA: YceI family protein [Casimicrobiaceae bacterium]